MAPWHHSASLRWPLFNSTRLLCRESFLFIRGCSLTTKALCTSRPLICHAAVYHPQSRDHSRPWQYPTRISLGCSRYVHLLLSPLSNTVKRTSRQGHEIVATIAQSHLHPQVLNSVCSILASDSSLIDSDVDRPARSSSADPPCYLATVATWADKIRNHARWSAGLHFINGVGDHPPDDCRFPGADGWGGRERVNVLDAVQNVSSILTEFVSGSSGGIIAGGAPELALEALKFLIHFVGDMHQPLHLCGRDRGGNSDKVTFDGRVTSASRCFSLFFSLLFLLVDYPPVVVSHFQIFIQFGTITWSPRRYGKLRETTALPFRCLP
jgi:S1/P1 Nuclease